MESVDSSSPKTILPECAVCMEPYLPPCVPKSMPCCGHTVCLKCLLRLERDADSRLLACPECRTPSKLGRGGVEAFHTNIAIQRIVSQLGGVSLQDGVTNQSSSTSSIRARKNPSEVPLSAPSSVSHSKGPIRVMMPTINEKLTVKKDQQEKRPPKPLPIVDSSFFGGFDYKLAHTTHNPP